MDLCVNTESTQLPVHERMPSLLITQAVADLFDVDHPSLAWLRYDIL